MVEKKKRRELSLEAPWDAGVDGTHLHVKNPNNRGGRSPGDWKGYLLLGRREKLSKTVGGHVKNLGNREDWQAPK